MDVSEIGARKAELEDDILDLIRDYEVCTMTSVEFISVERVDLVGIGSCVENVSVKCSV